MSSPILRRLGRPKIKQTLVAIVFAIFALAIAKPVLAEAAGPAGGGQGTGASTTLTTSASTPSAKTPIEPGDYYIIRANAQGRAIDVSGASGRDGANIQLYQTNDTKAQLWRISYDKQGRYTIENAGSGKALDAAGGRMANGTNIWQYRKNGTAAQQWYIESVKGGFSIVSAKNRSFVVDCAGGKTGNGTNIQLYLSNGTAAQKFLFVNANPKVRSERTVPDGIYTIGSKVGANKMVDVSGASTSNQANVQLYQGNGTAAQRWKVAYGKDGYYTVECLCSGLVLDVAGAKKTPGGNVWQYKSNGTKAQKWAISKNSDGTYSLVSACNGLALSVAGGKNANGANIQTAMKGGATAQKFMLTQVQPLDNGVYTFYTKLGSSNLAMGVKGESVGSGAQMQIQAGGGAVGQRFYVRNEGKGLFSLQSLASGQYVTDENGKMLQRPRGKSGALANQQLWRVGVKSGGVVFTNAGTGRAIAVSGGKAANGAALIAERSTGSAAQTFRTERHSLLVDPGNYTLYTRAGNLCLDVSGGSWASGANAQIYTPNNTNAQKFTFVNAGSGYYWICMALSGTRLTAGAPARNGVANVSLQKAQSGDAQLWKVALTDAGIQITSKRTGGVLTFTGKTASGANVCTTRASGGATQLWRLQATAVNAQDSGSMSKLVNSINGHIGGGVKLDAKGHSYSMSGSAWKNLSNAINYAWRQGDNVGFVMMDIGTGMTVSLDGDRRMRGASTIKAAYVTYVIQDLLETGRVSFGSVRWLIEQTIVDSNNDTYSQLRGMYGNSGFRAWLNTVGLGYLADESYPSMTAKELALIWTKLYAYETGGGRYTWFWRQTFNHSYFSCIREALSGWNTVYSKPGWVPWYAGYAALNDAAIVIDSSGRPYILAILSDVYCYGDQWIIRGIANALDGVHREMPAA